jgi:hypothetical protein
MNAGLNTPRNRLNLSWLVASSLGLVLAGCVTRSQADAQARAAFAAGQQQATLQMQQSPLRDPTVTVLGQVRNSILPWTAELSLAKAIVASGYYGVTDPTQIVINRDGREISVDPKQLLNGEDVPLQPRDAIQIK